MSPVSNEEPFVPSARKEEEESSRVSISIYVAF